MQICIYFIRINSVVFDLFSVGRAIFLLPTVCSGFSLRNVGRFVNLPLQVVLA